MKTNKLVLILNLLALFALSACSKKTVEPTKHDQDSAYVDQQVIVEEKLPEEISGLKTFENNLPALNHKLEDPKFDSTKEIIDPLKKYFFDASMISNSDYTNQTAFHKLFNLFSRAILIETQKGNHLELIKQYYQTLQDACKDDISNCHALEFYKRSPFSYQVMKKLLDQKMNTSVSIKKAKGIASKEYLEQFNQTTEVLYVCRYIRHQSDNSLDEITLKLMNDYQKLDGSKEVKKIEKNFKVKPLKAAKLLFNWFETEDQTMLKNAFKISRIDSSLNDYGFAAKNYLVLASKVLLQNPEKNKALFNDELKIIKASAEKQKGTYFFAVKKIQLVKQANKHSSEELKKQLQELNQIDPHFFFKAEDLLVLGGEQDIVENPIHLFLIDRMYEKHLSLEDVNTIWSNYIKNINDKVKVEKEFLTVAKDYLKTMIFYKTITSHNDIKNQFHTYDGSKENKLKSVLNYSNIHFKDWEETLEKIKDIHSFMQTHLSHGDKSIKEYMSLSNSIEVLDENIKMFSIWPLMMYFSYQFKNDTTSKLSNFLNTEFSIDGFELARIFNETESAWIPLTSDSKPLTTLKAIYSMSYLMSMGLLNSDKGDTDQVSDFLVHFVKKFSMTMKNEFTEQSAKLNRLIARPEMNKYVEACSAYKNMDKNQKPIKVELALTDLDKTLFVGTDNAGIGSAFLKFYSSSGSSQDYLVSSKLITFLKEVNSLYNFQNQVIESVQKIYQAVLEGKVSANLISKQEKENRLSIVNSQIEKLSGGASKQRNIFEEEVFKLYGELDKCMIDFLGIENSVRNAVLNEIKPYFKDIYQSLNQQSPNNDDRLVPVKGPEGYQGYYSMISNDSYNMHKIDIMIKIAEILEGLKSVTYKGKDVLIHVSVNNPSNFYNLDMIKRPSSGDIRTVNNEESLEEFEKEILLSMLTWTSGNGDKFINWFGETYDLDKIMQKIELSRELLKASYYHTTAIEKSIAPNSIIGSLMQVSDYLSISEDDEKFLTLFRMDSKHNPDQIKKLYYKNNELLPISENYFLALKEEILPKTYLGIGLGTVMETIHFYKSQRDMDQFFFNIDQSITDGIKEIYQEVANRKMMALKDFMEASQNYKQVKINVRHFLGSDKLILDGSEAIYDSEVWEDNASSIRKTFYEETKCFYKKTNEQINQYFKINIETCERL